MFVYNLTAIYYKNNLAQMAFNMQMREVTFVGIINILVLTG